MLNGDGNENGQKKINRLSKQKKNKQTNNNNNNNNFARAAHFFVHLYGAVLHDYNVKLHIL